ncbi:hypothetical protein AK812_SmicGene37367 [Symbiodinium microadriaticum]|uniref:Uncharacterized protein n=1 Tax=Symbiodinium microadriaticum TaxID=2951 RepID=A0A1Q9CGH3_SYMMI|nr:hypothetical protein AK812_SmicGene37367 [Symbiodinium microadriaticum]
MTCLEPIQPQRFDGYLHVIRYPSCIKGVHDGYAAIIADLSRVGGSFFATILPRNMSYPDLIEFITPLSSEDEAPFRVFVGAGSRPWPPEALVTLRDGDVITVTRHAHFSPASTVSTQLADRSAWGHMEHFFSVELHSCIGVLYGSKRWCIAEHFHYGETIIDHVVRCLRLDVGRIATCTFYTPDLDIQGSHCPKLVAVQDIRPIHDTPATRARQDIFILCDLRPLGLKPVFVYSHVTTIHVPSLLSDLGVDLPSAFQVGIHGGYHFGDHVSVDYSCTLLFYAKEVPGESSSDDSPPARLVSPVDVEDPAYSVPASEDFDVPPRASSGSIPPWVDPSVPLGHSWNSVEEFSTSVWQEFPTEEDRLNVPPGPFRSAASFGSLVRHARPLDSSEWIDHSFDDTGGTVYDSAPPSELQSASMPDPPGLPAQPDDTDDVDESLGGGIANHRLRAFNTYIYVPDTLPELVNASAFMPCSIDTALAAVAGARERDAVQLFPRVILASPQPDREFLVAVALPNWLQERPVVLLDCRRVNRTMFAKLLHGSLNRESLLRAAGLSCRSTWDVFVHRLLQPLAHGQRITLVSGMLITIVPCGCGAPATDDAAALLTAGDSWDLDAVVTAPGGSPGQHFWLLTDGMPAVFEVRPGRRPTFKSDIAEHLRVQDHALTLIGVSPRIVNTFFDGIWTSGVLVGYPLWPLTSSGPFLPITDVTDRFTDLCPREHCVTVLGADTVTHLAERCFAVKDGTVLVVQFTEDLLAGFTPDSPPHSDREDEEDRDDSHPGEGPPRNRSRTPARSVPAAVDGATDASRPAASEEDEHTVDPGNTNSWSAKWSNGKHDDAFAEGGLSPTPVGSDRLGSICRGDLHVPARNARTFIAEVSDVMREWFPTLIPAAPQPDPRAAYILAAPEWITDQVLICIDLVPLDGRVFAAYTPSLTDKHSLLNLAGISGAAEVDLYVPGHETAVDFGVDIFVSHGMSITIAPPEAPIGPSVLLAEMLRTHLPWDERFSHDMRHHGDRFCLVADGFFRDFLLQPSRAMYYLHDIAVIFGLSTHRAALTPAAHRIGDVSIYGRSCRAVAAVSPTHSGAVRNDVIGLTQEILLLGHPDSGDLPPSLMYKPPAQVQSVVSHKRVEMHSAYGVLSGMGEIPSHTCPATLAALEMSLPTPFLSSVLGRRLPATGSALLNPKFDFGCAREGDSFHGRVLFCDALRGMPPCHPSTALVLGMTGGMPVPPLLTYLAHSCPLARPTLMRTTHQQLLKMRLSACEALHAILREFEILVATPFAAPSPHELPCYVFRRLAARFRSTHGYYCQMDSARQYRRDRDAYVSSLADQLAQSPASELFQSLHSLLGHRRRKKYQVDPLPAVMDREGHLCRDADSAMSRWREHFGGMEGGQETSFSGLMSKWAMRIQASADDCPWPMPSDLSVVPTEADLQRLLVSAKAGKSPGMDGIPVEVPSPVALSQVVWADDLAVPRITETEHAAKAIGVEAGVLTDAFKEFGFSLTFGPHKTAGLLTLRGAGSRKARQSVFGPRGLGGSVPVLLKFQNTVRLPLVNAYRHLGCQQAPAGSLKQEIQYRVSQARATFAEGRRKVYKNPKISVRRKGHILGSTVIPKLVYGAGAWGPLNSGETRTFSGALWSFYRPLLGIGRCDAQNWDASTCFALLGLPSPSTLLRTQRLLYLGQMLRAGPDELWAVLRADRPHASLLQADIRWLHEWTHRTTGLPNPDLEWSAWVSFVQQAYGKYKGAVKRARMLDIHRHAVVAALSGLHRALVLVCGTVEGHAREEPPVLKEVCIPCRRAFSDRLSWAGHAARKHGYRSHAYLCAQGTLCLSCGRQFSSAGRLRRHLYAKTRCVREWGSFTPAQMSDPPLDIHALAPPVPIHGSFAPDDSAGIRVDVACGLLGDLGCDPADETEAWNLVTSYVEPIDTLRQTVREWAASDAGDEVRQATAENLLLLLDVELLAEHVQPRPGTFCAQWQPLHFAACSTAVCAFGLLWPNQCPPS